MPAAEQAPSACQEENKRTSGIGIGGIAVFACLLAASLLAAEAPQAAPPAVQLLLGLGEGTATPRRTCCACAGGGNVLVTQPANDTIATSMTGVVVAKSNPLLDSMASYTFELRQDFEVVVSDPKVPGCQAARWKRGSRACCAAQNAATEILAGRRRFPSRPDAVVRCGPRELLELSLPTRSRCRWRVTVRLQPGRPGLRPCRARQVHAARGLRHRGDWRQMGRSGVTGLRPSLPLTEPWIPGGSVRMSRSTVPTRIASASRSF